MRVNYNRLNNQHDFDQTGVDIHPDPPSFTGTRGSRGLGSVFPVHIIESFLHDADPGTGQEQVDQVVEALRDKKMAT